MDDELAVRVLHRVADGAKEPQAFVDRQAVVVGILVDGHAVDVLHDEIRKRVVGHPAVE